MQRRITGKKINYRPMIEAELSENERERVYARQALVENHCRLEEQLLRAASSDLVDADPESARWYCLHVWSGREFAVEKSLSDAGVITLVPRMIGQFQIRRGMRVQAPDRPSFPGYILVRLVPTDAAFLGLLQVRHVLDIVGSGARFHVVQETDVEVFRQLGEADVPRVAADKSFSDGDHADIIAGPFAGFMCLVVAVKWCRQPSARVVLSVYGRQFEIESMPLAFMKKL